LKTPLQWLQLDLTFNKFWKRLIICKLLPPVKQYVGFSQARNISYHNNNDYHYYSRFKIWKLIYQSNCYLSKIQLFFWCLSFLYFYIFSWFVLIFIFFVGDGVMCLQATECCDCNFYLIHNSLWTGTTVLTRFFYDVFDSFFSSWYFEFFLTKLNTKTSGYKTLSHVTNYM